MAIGVNGQYLLSFNLEDKKDFIKEADLAEFKLIEEAGNLLPTFELNFKSEDETILPLLNEGSDLDVQFGQDRDSLQDIALSVIKVKSQREGLSARNYQVIGILSALPYITDSQLSISTSKSGVEVLKDIVSKNFKTKFNILKSNDKQIWIQPNSSDKKFVNELWMHSFLNNSFIATAISAESKFILKDIKKDLDRSFGKEFDFRFTNTPKTSTDIPYDRDYILETQTGFLNNWMGYGREKLVYLLETGLDEFILEKPDPILSLTKELARRSGIEKRFAGTEMQNDNTHDKYWEAFLNNLTNLAVIGSVSLTLSFHNLFAPIQLLDLAMFRDDALSEPGSAEFHSGLYYVSKVTRIVGKKQFITMVKLVRESLNQVQNKK